MSLEFRLYFQVFIDDADTELLRRGEQRLYAVLAQLLNDEALFVGKLLGDDILIVGLGIRTGTAVDEGALFLVFEKHYEQAVAQGQSA